MRMCPPQAMRDQVVGREQPFLPAAHSGQLIRSSRASRWHDARRAFATHPTERPDSITSAQPTTSVYIALITYFDMIQSAWIA